jgi:hypothetical protein
MMGNVIAVGGAHAGRKRNLSDDFEFDVALSFAGEDLPAAAELAHLLHTRAVRVFYDEYEQATLCCIPRRVKIGGKSSQDESRVFLGEPYYGGQRHGQAI